MNHECVFVVVVGGEGGVLGRGRGSCELGMTVGLGAIHLLEVESTVKYR